MNLFVTSEDPFQCAAYLDNKRLVKMVLETTQLLSSALWLNGHKGPYKLTHKGHPITKWVSMTRGNYLWTLMHLKALGIEYKRRYNKEHKSITDCYLILLNGLYNIPDGQRTDFINCAANKSKGLDFRSYPVFQAYKLYLDTQNNKG